jgi:hypothetical protein
MNVSDKLPSLANQEEAIELARMLFDRYDVNRSGYLEPQEIETMMRDVPRILNSKPSYSGALDVPGYIEVLDANRDGRVCFKDVETYVLRFFS